MFHLYGLIVGIAIVVGYSLAEKLEPRVGRVAPWIIGFGIVGARIWHVFLMWEDYSHNLIQILMVWRGGMSIWGAMIGGGLAWWMTSLREESEIRMRTIGAIVVALPLAQAIGRVANGVNGEFINKVGNLPWWGAEAVLDLILFGVVWFLPRVSWKVWGYLIGYGLIRLVLQPYR